ncbi:GGDEF domain-containing protein [Sphingobium scionense]
MRHRRERQITALAERDSLTGAYNRRAFEAKATAGMALARRAGQPVALLLCDVDHFKAVNDGFGHATGDRLLSALAGILTDSVPVDALVARLGGDEFAVLLFGLPPENLPALGRRICHRFAQSGADIAGLTLPVSTSIGAATSVRGIEAMPHLFDRADRALYDAKRKGRDRISLESGAEQGGASPPLRLAKVARRACVGCQEVCS